MYRNPRIRSLVILITILIFTIASPVNAEEMEASSTVTQLSSDEISKSLDHGYILPQLQANGPVRLIVKVNTDTAFRGLSYVAASQHHEQMKMIDKAQNEFMVQNTALLESIVTFDYIPYVSVWVKNEAEYTQLLASPSVVTVIEDVPVPTNSNTPILPTMTEANSWINADYAHSLGYDGTGYAIAVLDTGVDKDHFYLDDGKVISEACFSTNGSGLDPDPAYTPYTTYNICPGGTSSIVGTEDPGSAEPYAGSGGPYNICPDNECEHGTHVAGIAAGTHPDFSGAAPDANIIAIQVFSRFNSLYYCGSLDHSSDCTLTYSSDQISALEHIYRLRDTYKIAAVNMSLGGGRYGEPCDGDPEDPINFPPDPRKEIIDNLAAVNIPTVISAGNDWLHDGVSAPSCISTAYTIGATEDISDAVTEFSNADADILDMWAPGLNITSSITTEMNGTGTPVGTWNGTSMAAPVVAGGFAMMREAYPTYSLEQIWTVMSTAGVIVTDNRPALYYSEGGELYTPTGDTVAPRIDFTTAIPTLAAPALTSPSNLSSSSSRTPTFDWEDVEFAYNYLLEYSTDESFNSSEQEILTESTFTPGTDLSTGTWYWRVKATAGGGANESIWSEVWSTTIVDDLGAPTLLNPSNGYSTYNLTPTFDWSDVTNADNYVLQYADNDQFSNAIEVTETASTYTPSSEMAYGNWFWHVKATNATTESSWSEVWNFTVVQDPFWLREFGYGEGWENPETPRTAADVNGDGVNDLIGFSTLGVQVALGTGTGFEPSTQWIASFGSDPSAGGWGGANTIRTVADVNGDGMADIVGFGNYGVMVSLSTGSDFEFPTYWVYGFGSDPAAGGWSSTENNRVVKDVNGDGMDDVVGYGSYGVLVSLSTGTSFEEAQYWAMGYGSILGGWDGLQNPRLIADINGDECGDIVGFSNWGVLVSLSYACEVSPVHVFGEPTYWAYGYAYLLGDWDSTRHIRTFSDVDGDGDEDLVGFADAGVLVSPSNGTNGLGEATYWIMGYGYMNGGWDVNQHPRSVADVNGDGMGDVVGYATDGVLIELSDGTKFD